MLPQEIHPNYRPDIDGLRAIAILSVLGFHAFPNFIKGGFIGVDIFFVISGYLITSIIISNLENDNFSFLVFFMRRIKRIFPALIIIMLTSLALGWFVLFSDEFQQLGKNIEGGAAFVANFVFWGESGYFDNAPDTKPMLHLWSLGIEEQFYILWPLLLSIVWKRKSSFFGTTAVIAIISFVINIFLSTQSPIAAFYSPLSRFWELMIGGLLAYITLHRRDLLNTKKNVQSLIGFILVAVGLVTINKDRSYPGWWGLLPTMGTFFIIAAGSNAWLNRYFLSNRLMVLIGLISYPLYLWHWPLLSFTRIVNGKPPSDVYVFAVILLSFVLAYLTYFFVEKNIRLSNRKYLPITLLSIMFLIFMWSGIIDKYEGLPQRDIAKKFDFSSTINLFKDSRVSDNSCIELNNQPILSEEVCLSNSLHPKVLFAGDSHAMALYSAIFAKRVSIDSMLVAGHSCPLYPNLEYTPTYKSDIANNCTAIANDVIKTANRINSIDTVVLVNIFPYSTGAANWETIYRLNGHFLTSREAFVYGTENLIGKLTEMGKKVIFFIDIPRLKFEPKDCIQRMPFVTTNKCEFSVIENNVIRQNYVQTVLELKNKFPNLIIINPLKLFCGETMCNSKFEDSYLYFDNHHMSIYASQQILLLMHSAGYF